MRHREPLFSVHATGDGEFAIYLEERDANLDLLEDVTDQVNLIDLAGLKEFASVDALKHLDAASRLDKVRAGMPNVISSTCIRFRAATRPRFLRAVYCTHIFPPPPPGWMTRGIMGGLGSEM